MRNRAKTRVSMAQVCGVNMAALRGVSHGLKDALRRQPVKVRAIPFCEYHGFRKSGLPASIVMPVFRQNRVDESTVQVDIVSVVQDLTHEVHYHEHASAYVIVLGGFVDLPDPRDASVFVSNRWVPVAAGAEFEIPAGMPHGFTVRPGGVLYFLSVQSPPIVSGTGHDDYIRTGAFSASEF